MDAPLGKLVHFIRHLPALSVNEIKEMEKMNTQSITTKMRKGKKRVFRKEGRQSSHQSSTSIIKRKQTTAKKQSAGDYCALALVLRSCKRMYRAPHSALPISPDSAPLVSPMAHHVVAQCLRSGDGQRSGASRI